MAVGHWGRRRTLAFAVGCAAAAAVCLVYHRVDPCGADSLSRMLPRCWWRELTGWSCPACGLQRALHAALHGHLAEAAAHNYFLTLSVPLLAGMAACDLCLPRGCRWRRRLEGMLTGRLYVALLFLWWIARNLLKI